MGTRFYKFFAIMRMAMNNRQLEFSAPGNKKVHNTLVLLREKGLIAGFCLDFESKRFNPSYWTGYPKYKVFLKYSYVGLPIIKQIDCYKLTKTNYLTIKQKYPQLRYASFWLISQKRTGLTLLTNFELKNNNNCQLLARIKV